MKFSKIYILLLAAGFFSCRGGEENREQVASGKPVSGTLIRLSPEQIKNAGIKLEYPAKAAFSEPVQVSGVLDVPPQNLHSLGARVSGMIAKTTLLQGSHVHLGDVLCVLENPEFLTWQQEYLGNVARLDLLRNDMKRQQGLADKNISSQKVLQQVVADFKILEASQNALRRKLQITGFRLDEIEKGNFSASLPVLAPADGFVTAVYINTGQVVSEGTPLCELVNMDHIHAELMVFEKDVAKVREGQAVEFELVAAPGIKYGARVFMVNHKISKDRTVQVHAHLDEMRPEFLPNMQVTARIKTGGNPEWTVPSGSVISFGSQSGIYAESESPGSFRMIPVEVLGNLGKTVAIKFPVGIMPENLKVVANGAYDLKAVAEKSAAAED